MKQLSVLLFLLTPLLSFCQDTLVDSRTGVKIIFISEGKIFPESWYSTKINASAVSLDKSEYARSERMIRAALEKYPTHLINTNLKEIYILKSVTFYGQSFGGTNATSKVYLSNKGLKAGYTDHYLEQLFHAEFSSILLRNNKTLFSESAWTSNNIDDFKYGKDGVSALKEKKASEKFETSLNEIGFINQYATSSLENDFNSFAKNLFMPNPGFDNVLKNYYRLRNKRKLIIQFYQKLDQQFNEVFFNQILYPV